MTRSLLRSADTSGMAGRESSPAELLHSRRRFLGLAAAGAGVALFGRAARLHAADDYGGFAMGLQTYTLRGFPVDKALDLAKELGVTTLEFGNNHINPNASEAEIDSVKVKAKSLGLVSLAHGVSPFTKDHEANRKIFEFGKRLGVRTLSADPHEDAFDSLDKLVAEYDIRIAIHNHGPGARTTRSRTC